MASRPLTLAIAQFRPKKGELDTNLDRIGALIAQALALEPRPQVVVFAETVTSGYFVEGGVREMALSVDALLGRLGGVFERAVAGPATVEVVLGFYESFEGNCFNSAATIRLTSGEAPLLLHVHRKNFLPTYSLFDEERFVERGYTIRAFGMTGARAAMLVCEDAWHSMTGTIAALDGAEIIFVLAAAPARGTAPTERGRPGSVDRWERLIKDIAEEHGVYCVLANLVGSEGGRLFQGGSFVAGPRGDVRVQGPIFEEALLSATIDLADLTRVRSDLPLLSDLRVALPYLRAELERVANREPS